jgi:hypothetical protein
MRTAIGLIGLGVAGGILPTGTAGIAHVAPVVGGAVAALTLLVGACLAAPALWRRVNSTPKRATKAAGPVAPLQPVPASRPRI